MSSIDTSFLDLKSRLEAELAADLAALQRVYERGLLPLLVNAQSDSIQVSGNSSARSALSAIVHGGAGPGLLARPIRTAGRRTTSMATELAVLGLVEKLGGTYTVADLVERLQGQGRPTPRTSVREALDELVGRGIALVVRPGKAGRATVYRTAPSPQPPLPALASDGDD